ncbi:MAG: sugar phosphate isomerase/epimerase family protein [Thermomicrobiales bacterium]
MTDTRIHKIKFATDLCTFYNPRYWGAKGGYDNMGDLFSWGKWDEFGFWERIFNDVAAAGLDGIEITFPPGDYHSATRAYGSAQGFADRVKQQGLEICSGFLSTRVPGSDRRLDFGNVDDRAGLVELAEQYAEFLNVCDAVIMVSALGIRANQDGTSPRIVDFKLAETIAKTLNLVGAATARSGIRLALHPEAFCVLRDSRDTDLFMLLTDPAVVSLCPDTAQYTVAGSNPIEIVSRHRDRIALTHWKDAVGPAPKDVPIDDTIFARQIQWFAQVGQGVVDWPAWVRLLREIRYEGWAVFELDGALDPAAELRAIRGYVEASLSHIYR